MNDIGLSDIAPKPLQLDLGRLTPVHHDPTLTIQQRFESFDKANPWVRLALIRLARDAKARGRTYGIGALYERLRWEYDVRLVTAETFKLNNDYRSRYARTIAAECPALADYFRTRELRAA